MSNAEPHEFAQFSSLSETDCADCTFQRDDPIHAVRLKLVATNCDCCGRNNVPTPYHHDNHNPPYDGYDYCQDCYDLGCGGPGECMVVWNQTYGKEGTVSNTIADKERLELQLSLGMDDDGSGLSEERRVEIQAQIDEINAAEGAGLDSPEVLAEIHHQVAPTEQAQPQGAGGLDENAVRQMIAEQLAQVGGATALPQNFTDVLNGLDPRDSDAALAMFDWLASNGRLATVGTLSGGGYLLHYSEPKGTTKAGYTPGATQGGRMVDQAVRQAKDSGAKARKTGMCDKCWSAVEQLDDGTIVLDDDTKNAVCANGGAHTFNG